jgi:4-hydroxybenzoate polyprenyltransferase
MIYLTRFWRAVRGEIWWKSKVVPLLGLVAFTISDQDQAPGHILVPDFFVFLFLAFMAAIFGHMTNDLFDRELDAAAGKVKAATLWNRKKTSVVLVGLLALILSTTFVAWPSNSLVMLLWTSTLISSLIYSAPPLRLKAHGTLGWMAVVYAQRTGPALIAVESFGTWSVELVLLTILLTVTGLRFIIIHQIDDSSTDLSGGIRSGVLSMGLSRVTSLTLLFVWPIEVGSQVLLIFACFMNASWLGGILMLGLCFSFLESGARGLFARGIGVAGLKTSTLSSFVQLYLPAVASLFLLASRPDLGAISGTLLGLILVDSLRKVSFLGRSLLKFFGR